MKDEDFFLKLREEILKTRDRRIQFQLGKLTSIGSLIGIGALLVEKMKVDALFYILPFIAIVFDLFILAESFTLKRITSFISLYNENTDINDAETKWERYVKKYPDKLFSYANLGLTLASLIGSAGILMFKNSSPIIWLKSILNLSWLFITLVSILTIKYWVEAKVMNRNWKISESEETGRNKQKNLAMDASEKEIGEQRFNQTREQIIEE